MSNLIAIVPARKESRRIQDKNTLPFADSNLLIHKLRQLKRVKEISEIYVSSEDDTILRMAKNEGAIVLKRPEKYAEKSCLFAEFVEYICREVKGEHILWACVTSPFITPEIYDDAIKIYQEKIEERYDSLITVQSHKRYILDKNGSINYRKGMRHVDSEYLPDLFLFTNGIELAPREKMIQWRYTWGHIPFMYEVDKKAGMDISDQFDYEVARLIWEQEQRRSSEWEK